MLPHVSTSTSHVRPPVLFPAAQVPSRLLEPVLQVQKLSEKHAAQLEAFHYAIEMRRPCRPKYSKDLLNQRKVGRCPLLTLH